MESIFAIAISDFNQKIHFLQKTPESNLENITKITKSLNKSLSVNYLQEHMTKGIESKLIDTLINPQLKVKISVLGEIIINIIYDSSIDNHYINIINQRLIECLYNMTKTKKLKIELLGRKYVDVCNILYDTLYLLDPRIRITSKSETQTNSFKDMVSHTIYMQKFNKAGIFLRSIAYHHSSKFFSDRKIKIDSLRKLKKRNMTIKFDFTINDKLTNFIINKQVLLNIYNILIILEKSIYSIWC